jgi:hypothetical protein
MRPFFGPRGSGKYRWLSGGGRPAVPYVYCPEMGEEVLYTHCFECRHFKVWADGDVERCLYEYQELRQRGFYAKDDDEWLEYLHDLDPATWQLLIEQKENMERVRAEMEAEQLARPAPAEEPADGADAKAKEAEAGAADAGKDEEHEQDKDAGEERDEGEDEDDDEEDDGEAD